ncbi:TIM barrel protein [Marinobacter sp.]|uniref:sugar phosphate isomerase/epimerase family protein n=1 Tax=Marinobacter sp. TaxID=50741 RepID=UPI00258DB92D|nr:TIM barrel protein [Marinobacter sp.]MCW9009438.1 sugar phosphate isomerase/epimerase [Marinobacter sp.]
MKHQRTLSLHHLTALDVAPIDLPAYAAQAGCDYVGVFCDLPRVKAAGYPTLSPGKSEQQFREALIAHDISVNNLELFQIRPDTEIYEFREGLAMGNRLGARQITVHVHDADPVRSVAAFSELCRIAADYGLDVALEFTSFSAVRTLETALTLIRAANRTNGRLALDLLHFFRNGGTLNAIQSLEPHELGYVQVCDGLYLNPEDLYAEAVKNRMLPGDGEFPIQQVLSMIPDNVIVDVEVPQMRLKELGVSARRRIALAVERTIKTFTPR